MHETRCYWLKGQKLPHHPMQILVNFEIEGKCVRQSLPDKILRDFLSHFLLLMTDRLAYSGMQIK